MNHRGRWAWWSVWIIQSTSTVVEGLGPTNGCSPKWLVHGQATRGDWLCRGSGRKMGRWWLHVCRRWELWNPFLQPHQLSSPLWVYFFFIHILCWHMTIFTITRALCAWNKTASTRQQNCKQQSIARYAWMLGIISSFLFFYVSICDAILPSSEHCFFPCSWVRRGSWIDNSLCT